MVCCADWFTRLSFLSFARPMQQHVSETAVTSEATAAYDESDRPTGAGLVQQTVPSDTTGWLI